MHFIAIAHRWRAGTPPEFRISGWMGIIELRTRQASELFSVCTVHTYGVCAYLTCTGSYWTWSGCLDRFWPAGSMSGVEFWNVGCTIALGRIYVA